MSKKKIGVLFFLFCIAMISYQIVSKRIETSRLKKRGKITIGHVISFRNVYKSGNRVTYSFDIQKHYLEDDEKTDLDYTQFKNFVNKNFPVIYDTERPETNRILLTKSDYQLFKVPIPDTLKYIVNKTR